MSKILLVRHGQAAANWGEQTDPGLSELGQQQAANIQAALAPYQQHCSLSSPKARAQETAQIARPDAGITIDPRFTEIPSGDRSLADRGDWLRHVFKQRWSDQEHQVKAWRNNILQALQEQNDSIIFCHFVVINAIVAAAQQSDKVMQCRPDYCSIWEFECNNSELVLIKAGQEDESLVL